MSQHICLQVYPVYHPKSSADFMLGCGLNDVADAPRIVKRRVENHPLFF